MTLSRVRGAWRPCTTLIYHGFWCQQVTRLARVHFAREDRRRADAAGTEEAMSEKDVPTEQPPAGQETRVPPPDVDPCRAGHHQVEAAQGPPPPLGLIWRVDRRDTFEALRHGRRRRQGPITVSWISGDPTEPPRVAYTIGRRVGSAVVRNRVRRRLRMLIREAAPTLRPGAYLIGVGPAAALLSYEELREILQKALKSIQES